jgi:hypothetical protein
MKHEASGLGPAPALGSARSGPPVEPENGVYAPFGPIEGSAASQWRAKCRPEARP